MPLEPALHKKSLLICFKTPGPPMPLLDRCKAGWERKHAHWGPYHAFHKKLSMHYGLPPASNFAPFYVFCLYALARLYNSASIVTLLDSSSSFILRLRPAERTPSIYPKHSSGMRCYIESKTTSVPSCKLVLLQKRSRYQDTLIQRTFVANSMLSSPHFVSTCFRRTSLVKRRWRGNSIL